MGSLTESCGTVVAVMGPTASGKARLSLAAADAVGATLLSCDSMKVYRRMDVGTAKPAPELRARWVGVDVVEPWESYDADRFCQAFDAARQVGRPLLLSGGTMLYLKAATEGLVEVPSDDAVRARLEHEAETQGSGVLHARLAQVDPPAAARIHPNDQRRIVRALEAFEISGQPLTAFQGQFGGLRRGLARRVFVVRRSREDMKARIDVRVDRMLEQGWVDECRRLLADPHGVSREGRQALGYRELFAWLEGGEAEPLEDVVTRIKTATRRFARKQLTWLKKLPDAEFLDVGPEEEPVRTHIQTVVAALQGTNTV